MDAVIAERQEWGLGAYLTVFNVEAVD